MTNRERRPSVTIIEPLKNEKVSQSSSVLEQVAGQQSASDKMKRAASVEHLLITKPASRSKSDESELQHHMSTKRHAKHTDHHASRPTQVAESQAELSEFQQQFADLKLNVNSENNILRKNLEESLSKIRVLQTDVHSGNRNMSDSVGSILNIMERAINALSIQVQSILEQEEDLSPIITEFLPRMHTLRDTALRYASICEDLSSCQQPKQVDEKQRSLLRLLQKVNSEETSYTSKLICLQRFFRESLASIITSREETVLFSTLSEILSLHKDLLRDVRFTLNSYPDVPVGQLFLHYTPKFTPYIAYIRNFSEAKEVLEKLLKDKEISKTIKALEKSNKESFVDLLREPLRKVEQYMMYAEQFYYLTAPTSQDRYRLEEVVDRFQDLLDLSSTKDNIADTLQKLQSKGDEIEGMNENLVAPDRELAHEGALEVCQQPTGKIADYVFLFSDMLIFAMKQKTNKSNPKKYLFVDKILMHHVKNIIDESSTGFTLETVPKKQKEEYFLVTSSEKEKNDWLIHFRNVQRNVMRYRKVFGVPLKSLLKREPPGSTVPHFVEISTSFIREYGLTREGIFRLSGRASQMEKLRNQLDQGKKVFFSEKMDVHSVANLLKQWLRELPEPLLTWKLYDEFIQAEDLPEKEKLETLSVLINKKLPKINRFTFQTLMKLLTEVVANEAKTKLNASSLAVVFAPNVLSSAEVLSTNIFQLQYEAVNNVFKDMLVNYSYLFSSIESRDSPIPDTVLRTKKPNLHINASKALRRSTSLRMNAGSLAREQEPTRSSPQINVFRKAVLANSTEFEGPLKYFDKKQWIDSVCSVQSGKLYIHRSGRKQKMMIPLHATAVKTSAIVHPAQPFAFKLDTRKDTYLFATDSQERVFDWMQVITKYAV